MEGAIFLDLDGTILKWRTNEPLPGAVDLVERLDLKGVQIYFTTRRGLYPDKFKDHPVLSREATKKALKDLFPNIKYKILFGVKSPRIILNDEGCAAGNPKCDEGFEFERTSEVINTFEFLQDYLNRVPVVEADEEEIQ